MAVGGRPDSSHDLLRQERQPLDVFFSPQVVAVVGATETVGSVGRTILWNLIGSPFGGTVFPVNPKRASVLGIKAYPTLADVPAKIDLAVIVTPATAVPGIVGQCADLGIPAAVIISAGFREVGAAGAELERRTLAEARRGHMRLIGPNCLGVMSPTSGLNATFAAAMARPGNVAFLSQSGALLTAILDWSLKVQLGFSAFVSLGTMLDVSWGDLIDHFGNDPRTRSIVLYMESIGDDARGFLSAAREVALTKPIIVIKAGRTEAAARAAASHTGALTGSDEVLDAAFRRVGVLRVSQIGDVFDMAEVLGKQPRPRGPRLSRRHERGRSRRARDGRAHHPRRRARAAVGGDARQASTRSCPRPGATATPSTCSATPIRRATRARSRSRPPTPRTTACSSCSRRRT